MTITRSMLAMIASTAILAGCVASAPDSGGGQPIARAQSAVEGEWMSSDGVTISRFSGGVFETIATDTGNKLADGSYRHADARSVEITVRSLIRQTTSNVNCALVTPSQLNCTSSAGQQFIMTRRGTPA